MRRIVSGGQTGADQGALDAAMTLGIPCGGWCPRGRRSESGPIPDIYPMRETPRAAYPQRTAWNIRDSDGTLVLTRGVPKGGTALTVTLARRAGKPVLVVDPGEDFPEGVAEWLASEGIRTLNVAGPRESEAPWRPLSRPSPAASAPAASRASSWPARSNTPPKRS